ncbi:MAG: ATP phosphoribosyltransferase [Candidatus Eutrophobiaceae bacterium]
MITIALSKGRIYDEALAMFGLIGLYPKEEGARKLLLETTDPGIRFLIVRASDVPAYVVRGGADLGVTGLDVLMEHTDQWVYQPLDLGIACCRMSLAGVRDAPPAAGRLRIATKYVTATREWFAERGQQVEIVKLYGSMELAPLLGLADQIVDLVETGSTLKANGLEELETIAHISARLLVNPASLKMNREQIQPLIDKLEQVVVERERCA